MTGTHAKLSPSGAPGWMRCSGWESSPISSKYAEEGSDAHDLASRCLTEECAAAKYAGDVLTRDDHGTPRTYAVTEEMAAYVQVYMDNVRNFAAGGDLLVEQRVPISQITGEEDAGGTSDAIILQPGELQVHDLKYGMGVKVFAKDNEQLMMYALGALVLLAPILEGIERVRLVIHQPRLDHLDDHVIEMHELDTFFAQSSTAAQLHGKADIPLTPGEKQCMWCRKKATCKALAREVAKSTDADFEDLDQVKLPAPGLDSGIPLGSLMAKVGLIEDWCKAVRAATESALLGGEPVEGWKLVEGRRGARKWSAAEQAEQILKSFRFKQEQMYSFELISPTAAEKLLKESPIRWAKLEALVTQSEGKPSVAPATDNRKNWTPPNIDDDFQVLA